MLKSMMQIREVISVACKVSLVYYKERGVCSRSFLYNHKLHCSHGYACYEKFALKFMLPSAFFLAEKYSMLKLVESNIFQGIVMHFFTADLLSCKWIKISIFCAGVVC